MAGVTLSRGEVEPSMNPENTTEVTQSEDLTTESLLEEISIDGMCGVY
jgi:mycofactocin precursor